MTVWRVSRGEAQFLVVPGRQLPVPPTGHPPGAPPWLVGVASDHGRAVAVIDLAVLSGRPAERPPGAVLTLVQSPAGPLALLSDAPPKRTLIAAPQSDGTVFLSLPDGQCWVDLAALCQALGAP